MTFTLVWIGIYCILQSLANPLNQMIRIENFASAIFCIIQTIVLFSFMQKNRLLKKYGLCKPSVSARRFLYYIPLFVLTTSNLWNGAAVNCTWFETVCHICLMLCVGFIEEVLFRGFLSQAIAKDNVKTTIIISSITFGIGHLLNIINGSGMELAENLFQAVGATAFGLLFVMLFYRSGSLLPCIISHSAINILSAFADRTDLTAGKRIACLLIEFIIITIYLLVLTKTLPKNRRHNSVGITTFDEYILWTDCSAAEDGLRIVHCPQCALDASAIDNPLEYARSALEVNLQI